MISVEHPILFSLFIVLILPIVIFLLYKQWRQYALNALGQERNLRNLLTNSDFGPYQRTFILLSCALVCIILASVNFRRSDSSTSDWVKGMDVLVALDVSKSMLANDEKPTRLEKSKIFVKDVLSKLSNDQVGLLIFAGKSYIQAPLTNDYNMVKMLLDNAHPSQVPHMGTDISDPIHWSNELFDPEQMKYKVLLLISDGEDHNDNAIAMAEKAKEQGIVIITVGIGSKDGVPLMNTENYQPVTDENGQIVISKLNEDLLKMIAEKTNGEYVYLKNIGQASNQVVNAINNMEKKDIRIQQFSHYKSFFTIFALIALVILVLDHLKIFNKRGRRINASAVIIAMMFLYGVPLAASAQNSSAVHAVDTHQSWVHLYSGNNFYQKGEWDKALSEYNQSVHHNPGNYSAHFNTGNTHYHKNEFEISRSHYKNVLRLATSDTARRSYAYYNIGNSYLKEQKYREAVNEYIEGLKLNPTDHDMKYNLSYALKMLQNQQDQNKDNNKDDQGNQDNNNEDNQENRNNQEQDDPKDKKENESQPQNKLNKDQLEANLQSVSNNEKDIQKNRNKERGQFVRPEKDW